MSKEYLTIASQTRTILASPSQIDVDLIYGKIPKSIKTKKDALAHTALWMAVANTWGAGIPRSYVDKNLNRLKSKDNKSQSDIHRIIQDAKGRIGTKNPSLRKIHKILSTHNPDLFQVVAEEVGKGSHNQVVRTIQASGWKTFGVAVMVILFAKLIGRS